MQKEAIERETSDYRGLRANWDLFTANSQRIFKRKRVRLEQHLSPHVQASWIVFAFKVHKCFY